MKCRNFFLLILTCCFSPCTAQIDEIDSLYKVLKVEKDDTNKVITLNELSAKLEAISQYDSALTCAYKAQILGEKLGFNDGIADAYGYIGIVYDDKGNYPKALEYHFKSLTINQKLGDRSNIATNLGNIGLIYDEQGNYANALEYDFKALTIDQQIGNKSGIAADLSNIGLVYYNQGIYPKALEYDFKALAIYEGIGDKTGIARNLSNIGLTYDYQGSYPKALEYDFKALAIYVKIGNKIGIAGKLGNIGLIYTKQGNYSKAQEDYSKALIIDREIGDKDGIAVDYKNIGSLYTKQKGYKQAKAYLDSALILSKIIGMKTFIEGIYEDFSTIDSATGNYQASREDYKMYFLYHDSLINEANAKKTVQQEMNFEFEQKLAGEKAEQDKKDTIAFADKRKQNIITWSVGGGLLLVIVFAGFILRSLRITRKQRDLIEEKKTLVEEKNKIVEEQKKVVEEQKKDIIDSINYAKRIQTALLKEEEHVSEHLPEHFILFKPKDIVSGDFHWAIEKEEYFYVAAVDCTGHGVPGGFMSMLGIAFLNEVTAGSDILPPAEILNKLRSKILKELRQTGAANESKDGMDISLMRMNLKTKEILWSGANNALYILSGQSLEEILPDKQPIGYYPLMKPFTNNTIKAEKGSLLYLFTDGYADQFGGPKGKKFNYKQFEQLLLANCYLTMKEQKQKLDEAFENWRGNLEQVDDVCIIGIKV